LSFADQTILRLVCTVFDLICITLDHENFSFLDHYAQLYISDKSNLLIL